jgi:hypothetical protein
MCRWDHAHPQALVLSEQHRASFVGTVTAQLGFLLVTLPLDTKQEATDRFMRESIRGCYSTERFLLLHHTVYHYRPVFRGNAAVRVFWPWSAFANHRRRAGVMCFFVSEQRLHLEIQYAGRSKEEV